MEQWCLDTWQEFVGGTANYSPEYLPFNRQNVLTVERTVLAFTNFNGSSLSLYARMACDRWSPSMEYSFGCTSILTKFHVSQRICTVHFNSLLIIITLYADIDNRRSCFVSIYFGTTSRSMDGLNGIAATHFVYSREQTIWRKRKDIFRACKMKKRVRAWANFLFSDAVHEMLFFRLIWLTCWCCGPIQIHRKGYYY